MKPILTLKIRCPECDGTKIGNCFRTGCETKHKCNPCSGTGQITKNYYDLRDFEIKEMICNNCGRIDDSYSAYCGKCGRSPHHLESKGYKIHFKDYEIKKVSEITEEEAENICNKKENYKGFSSDDFNAYWKNNLELKPDIAMCRYWFLIECNLKELDKVVIVRCQYQ